MLNICTANTILRLVKTSGKAPLTAEPRASIPVEIHLYSSRATIRTLQPQHVIPSV